MHLVMHVSFLYCFQPQLCRIAPLWQPSALLVLCCSTAVQGMCVPCWFCRDICVECKMRTETRMSFTSLPFSLYPVYCINVLTHVKYT